MEIDRTFSIAEKSASSGQWYAVTDSTCLEWNPSWECFGTVNNTDHAQMLQGDLDALEEWSNLGQLKVNADKCKVMHLGNQNKGIKYHMHKEGVQVELQTTRTGKGSWGVC
jgi:hypothetical protein